MTADPSLTPWQDRSLAQHSAADEGGSEHCCLPMDEANLQQGISTAAHADVARDDVR